MIDLRSDTVTRPSEAMLVAMKQAETGDDVYGEDPTVNRLEALAADMTGKQAALYGISGTQTNLLALLSHCQRGHEYIAGSTAHTYQYEGGGGAVLGGIQPCTLPFNEHGELPLDLVEGLIKPDDYHFAMTRLICLENTQAGKVLNLDYLAAYSELAVRHNLRRHLDGARVFNAAVKLGVPVADICQHFDTVSICLSKGLGCPVGSLLVGDQETIDSARRWRKMLGGGMRQAGVIAAAGEYALKHNVARLEQDHQLASQLGHRIAVVPGFTLLEPVQTNMVMVGSERPWKQVSDALAIAGIRISGPRWVCHMDISSADIDRVIEVCSAL